MDSSSWLTTPTARHQAEELARARMLTAGLPSAYVAHALAMQERQRRFAVDFASQRLAAPNTEATPAPRRPFRPVVAALAIWLRRVGGGALLPPRRADVG